MSTKSLRNSGNWLSRLFIAFSVLLLLSAAACEKSKDKTETDIIELTFSTAYMPNEPPTIQANHALDLVEIKTNGRVKIKRFTGGALGGNFEQLDLVASGAVDIIPLHVDQFPQQLPLHQILNTQQLTEREKALANIVAITQEIPETKAILDEEQMANNIKILFWNVQGVTDITTGFPANSLADLKGKKVNVISSYQRKVFYELGFIPVNIQISELYESLSRGVIDAIFMATSAVVPLKWYEVAKSHITLGDSIVLSQPLTLNLNTWNSLPEDIRMAFMEASQETAEWSIEEDLKTLKNTYDMFEESGVNITHLSSQDSETFFEVLSRYATEDWLANAKNRGVADQAVVIESYWDDMKWGKQKR